MAETVKYGLYLTENDQVKFIDWREKISGQSGSNMIKIEAALVAHDEAIASLESKDTEMQLSIADAASDISALQEKTTSLETGLGTTNETLAKVSEESANNTTAISGLQESVTGENGLGARIDAMESSLSDMAKTDETLTSQVETLQTDLSTKADSSKVEEIESALEGKADASVATQVEDMQAALDQKANASISIEAVLYTVIGEGDTATSAWAGDGATEPYTQTIQVNGLTSASNGTISISNSANAEQRSAARAALLAIQAQNDGELVIVADGELPTVDIPVTVVIIG